MDPFFFFIKQEMKPASPVTEVKFNPETPNLGYPFQIYGSVDLYKIQPGPFYRLLGLFHLILLFFPPTTVLFVRAGFVRAVTASFIPGKCCPPLEKQESAPPHAGQSSERIISSVSGLTK